MSNPNVYKTGTATVTNGSKIVVGATTAWAIGLVAGGIFNMNGQSNVVESVEDDTHLTLAQPWVGSTASGVYSISRAGTEGTSVTDLLDRVTQALHTLSLAGIHPDDLGTLTYRNTLNSGLGPTDKFIFLRAQTGQPFEYYVWDGPVSMSWIGPFPVAIPPDAPSSGVISSNGSITNFIQVSQAVYDALSPPHASTVYVII